MTRVPFRSDEFWRGAAVAAGLLLMALAIREREDARQRRKDYEDRMLEEDMG